MDAGSRDRLVAFQRGAVTTDDHGGEVLTWADLVQAWSRVRYGTGAERREAAQDRASMAATFECAITPTLATVVETDRISFDGSFWGINGKALVGRDQVHFTATRSS